MITLFHFLFLFFTSFVLFFSLSCLHWHLGALGLCWVAPFSTGLLFVRLSVVLEQFQSDYLAFTRFCISLGSVQLLLVASEPVQWDSVHFRSGRRAVSEQFPTPAFHGCNTCNWKHRFNWSHYYFWIHFFIVFDFFYLKRAICGRFKKHHFPFHWADPFWGQKRGNRP